MQPYGPVVGGGYLVVLQVQELIGGHVVGQYIVTVGLEHRGEYDAMEDNVVLADKVHEPGLRVLPPFLPGAPLLGFPVTQFLGVGDITDGCVKPHVEHLAFRSLHGNGYAPVQVSCHGAGLQIHVQPALALPVDIAAPLLVPLQYPFLQPCLVFVEGQVPVLGLSHDGLGTADGRVGVDQLHGREVAAAFLALVAISSLGMAVGTLAHDVAVCQELVSFLVVVLFRLFLHQLAFLVEFLEEVAGHLAVDVAGGAAIDVEGDAKLLEAFLYHLVVSVHHVLGRDALFLGPDGDGHAVLVAAANEYHFLFLQPEISHVDVSGHIHAGQVAYVHAAVGVGQGGGHQRALEFLVFHIVVSFLLFLWSRGGGRLLYSHPFASLVAEDVIGSVAVLCLVAIRHQLEPAGFHLRHQVVVGLDVEHPYLYPVGEGHIAGDAFHQGLGIVLVDTLAQHAGQFAVLVVHHVIFVHAAHLVAFLLLVAQLAHHGGPVLARLQQPDGLFYAEHVLDGFYGFHRVHVHFGLLNHLALLHDYLGRATTATCHCQGYDSCHEGKCLLSSHYHYLCSAREVTNIPWNNHRKYEEMRNGHRGNRAILMVGDCLIPLSRINKSQKTLPWLYFRFPAESFM